MEDVLQLEMCVCGRKRDRMEKGGRRVVCQAYHKIAEFSHS